MKYPRTFAPAARRSFVRLAVRDWPCFVSATSSSKLLLIIKPPTMLVEQDATLEAVSFPYPMDRKRKKLRVAIVTGTWRNSRRKLSSQD